MLSLDQPGVAAITGASSGLGRAFALALARRGWALALSDVDQQGLDETRDLCAAAPGASGRFHTAIVDVRDVDAQTTWADEAEAQLGPATLVINNAGVAATGEVGVLSPELWDWVIDIDLKGVVWGCHVFVPRFRQRGAGHVINIASAAGFANAPNMGCYNVSKAGVISLSQTLAAELAGTRVGVTVACPTFFRTNIGNNTRGAGPGERKLLDKLVNQSKISPDTIAEAILRGAQAGELHVIPQPDAKLFWALRRTAPAQFSRLVHAATTFMRNRTH